MIQHTMETTQSSSSSLDNEQSNLLPSRRRPHEESDCEVVNKFWTNPWFLSIIVTTTMLVPTLVGFIRFVLDITSRTWPTTVFAIHLTVSIAMAALHVSKDRTNGDNNNSNSIHCSMRRAITSGASLLDILMCGFIYPNVWNTFHYFFQDIDGTIISEWKGYESRLFWIRLGMSMTVVCRVIVGTLCWFWILATYPHTKSMLQSRFPSALAPMTQLLRHLERIDDILQTKILRVLRKRHYLRAILHKVLLVASIGSMIFVSYCAASCVSHFTDWHLYWQNAAYNNNNNTPERCCDDLDMTECALPFPSFHHMVPDPSTQTKWRVRLEGSSLPMMRGGIPMDPSFLNALNGFSTMAPILFYLDGFKESHEAEVHGEKVQFFPHLVNGHLEDSITDRSVTLLWDVNAAQLVPHTAHVDYLDPKRPIVLVVPSQPLHHTTHYALAVINASDKDGQILPPTPGMRALFLNNADDAGYCIRDVNRIERYQQVLLPSLVQAAPWLSQNGKIPHPENGNLTLQLMFDFVTMSKDSLKAVRTVRDGTLQQIEAWDKHDVEIVKTVNHNCRSNNTLAARTIHGSLTVPWWLESSSRASALSSSSLFHGKTQSLGTAKFVMIIPCSLRAAALNETRRIQRPLRAVVEYGHGLFYNRAEASEHSLLRVAEDQGYLIMAMDWRGMSSFDMPVVMRTLLSTPRLLQATRDNLIQGYANKLVLQHFAKNGLLDGEWLEFQERRGKQKHRVPTLSATSSPTSVFYGSSQGGILGAGYTTLLGSTGLIDRVILGVPGTSFSLIMSRSNSFQTYDDLLIRNFYNNRHIRIVLSAMQLAWDPIEAAGVLAPPVEETILPTLLQSGLGDSIIPRMATEALARAYNASIVPNNPRKSIFGIQQVSPDVFDETNTTCLARGSAVTWTEMLYLHEYQNLPMENIFSTKENNVHYCLRQDCALISQMAQFINTGKIIDPCTSDHCLRRTLPCHLYWKRNSTKPSNWTCTYNQSCPTLY